MHQIVAIIFCLCVLVTGFEENWNFGHLGTIQDSVLDTFQTANDSFYGQFNKSQNDLSDFSDKTNETANETLDAIQQWLRDKYVCFLRVAQP